MQTDIDIRSDRDSIYRMQRNSYAAYLEPPDPYSVRESGLSTAMRLSLPATRTHKRNPTLPAPSACSPTRGLPTAQPAHAYPSRAHPRQRAITGPVYLVRLAPQTRAPNEPYLAALLCLVGSRGGLRAGAGEHAWGPGDLLMANSERALTIIRLGSVLLMLSSQSLPS